VQVARNDEGVVVEAGGEGFARRFGGVTESPSLRQAANEGALDEALGVENEVVGARSQPLPEVPHLAPGGDPAELVAPAPDGHRNHLANRRVQAWNVGEALLDAPVDAGFGETAPQVADYRQVVNYVT